jgi:hypothetical protein
MARRPQSNGGDDGTRTRGLCRDRATTTCNLLDYNGTDSPFLILEETLWPAYRTQISVVAVKRDNQIQAANSKLCSFYQIAGRCAASQHGQLWLAKTMGNFEASEYAVDGRYALR